MRGSKLTISALMGAVLFAGLGMAALSRPSELAAAALFSAAIVVLTVAILGAWHARGTARAFWSGFAVGGWMYLLAHYGPVSLTSTGTFPTAMLDMLYEAIAPPPSPAPSGLVTMAGTMGGASGMSAGMAGMMAGMGGIGGGTAPSQPPPPSAWQRWTERDWGRTWTGTRASSSFFRIGHSLLCLVAGLGAGLLARRWATHRDGEERG